MKNDATPETNKHGPETAHGATSELRSTAWLERRVQEWLETWAPHCGAPRKVFEGQFRATLAEIFDNIEERAEAAMMKTHKLEGMHYAALSAVRRQLQLRSRSNVRVSDAPTETSD